jgi:two-component system, NarL family, invasion response regulator UvrY
MIARGRTSPPGTASVVLVDDHDLVRLLLRRAIDDQDGLRVVGEAGDADAGVALVARLRPDVVVLDLGMHGLGALEAIGLIREVVPACRVVVFSASESEAQEQRARLAGADAYVEKRQGFAVVARQVAALALGAPAR